VADRNRQAWVIVKTQAGRRGVVKVLVEEESVAQIRKPEDAHHGRRESVCLLDHEVLRPMVFPDRETGTLAPEVDRGSKRVPY